MFANDYYILYKSLLYLQLLLIYLQSSLLSLQENISLYYVCILSDVHMINPFVRYRKHMFIYATIAKF